MEKKMEFLPISMQRAQRDIQRCGLAPKIQGYDLTQHSYGVLSICCDLVKLLQLEPLSQAEVELIMRHDLAETFTGDLPWIVKNMNADVEDKWAFIEEAVLQEKAKVYPELENYSDKAVEKALSAEKLKIFKIADMLDLLLYCCKEEQLGNLTEEMTAIRQNAFKITMLRVHDYCSQTSDPEQTLAVFRAYIRSSKFPLLTKCSELEYLED